MISYFLSRKKRDGFSIIELLVVALILTFLDAGVITVLIEGQDSWMQSEIKIGLQQQTSNAINKIVKELRESGFETTYKASYSDDTGINGTDVLKMSLYLDCNDQKRWSAPLTWGCREVACLDEDASCLTFEYKYVQYELGADNQLLRKVLDDADNPVREDVVAENIINFQINPDDSSPIADLVTLEISGSDTMISGRQIQHSLRSQVLLRNIF